MKAEPSWLIPLKPIESVELFIGYNISDHFRPEKLAATLRCLKPEKSPGLDSIFPELYLSQRLSNHGFAISSLHLMTTTYIWHAGQTTN